MPSPRFAFALALLLSGCASSKLPDLYRVSERPAIEAAARKIIAADRNAALVTLDANGQPRVRTVFTSEPDAAMTIWIATRPATRKVEQIRGNPLVTLYYSDDAALAYVSIMGRATLHSDEATLRAKNPFDSERTRMFFPDFPEDCVLIEVRPQWIEATGHGIEASADTWRPQAIDLRP